MILFKEIKIQPSKWYLDIIVSKNKKQTKQFYKDRYGLLDPEVSENECASVDPSMNSPLKGEKRIVVHLMSLSDKSIIVHELIHALWCASKAIGYEMNYNSQEWQAILFEYLFKEVINRKNYVKIN